ncbi:MAG TPA: uroporphyrinogen-III synthase [Ktedonobacteraceae bacterium]|jgi:uroporphyrinogen-III synthase
MFEPRLRSLSLAGKRVLVTRTREQAAALSASLRLTGAQPVELPVIRIAPPEDWAPLDRALRGLAAGVYDWLILTSANGVRMVLERLEALGQGPQALAAVRIAAIGPATAAALQRAGLTVALVPDEYIAEGIAQALRRDCIQRGETLNGRRMLLARAAEARQVLVNELEREGVRIEVVAAYQTLPVAWDDERGREVIALMRQRQMDVVTFTSSSTVHHFMHWLSQTAPDIAILLAYPGKQPIRPLIACIGPVTAQTARDYGLDVGVVAREFTTAGLIEALITYEETQRS